MAVDAMRERWMLFLDTTYQAGPWPWRGKKIGELTATDITSLPDAINDFGLYSPSDGFIEIAHVPERLPRQQPQCVTKMAIYHDADNLYVFQVHERPAQPLAELVQYDREDYSIVIQLAGKERGLYFGMNEKGESIGCVQLFEPSLQKPEDFQEYPWKLLKEKAGSGPSGTTAGILGAKDYEARVIDTGKARVGVWRIGREILASGIVNNQLRLSASRVCYQTGEPVCWGSSITWRPRMEPMGRVVLVEKVEQPEFPRVRRIDGIFDFANESAEFEASWVGPTNSAEIKKLPSGGYDNYTDKYTVALNWQEQTCELAPLTKDSFPVPNGYNKLEYLSSFAAPVVESFDKVSSTHICVPDFAKDKKLPSVAQMKEDFASWHTWQEKIYFAPGSWGNAPLAGNRVCLCHCGVFHMLPYALSCLYLDKQPVYLDRIRENCERSLAEQQDEGWYPCYCSGPMDINYKPSRFQGGAFTNGSVGEAMLVAAKVLGEKKYADSSRRAADACKWYDYEFNENYCAFALWHLSEMFEQTGEQNYLDRAVYYAKYFAGRDIGPGGAQDGHNFYTGYGAITLKGLARLLRVLPKDHKFYPVLRGRTLRFANAGLLRMQPDGFVSGRNRRYLGYKHLLPGLFEVAQSLPEEREALLPALVLNYRAAQEGARKGLSFGDEYTGLTIALMARFILNEGK